jgi:hypothetical protein
VTLLWEGAALKSGGFLFQRRAFDRRRAPNDSHLCISILLACFLAAGETGAAQQVIVTMTPESVDEAIRLATDEKATARFLDAYVLQTRAGWGNGPLIGRFSTRFARVVQAAAAARRKGNPFTPADVVPALIAPDLHVIAAAQTAATDEGTAAMVLSVVLARRGRSCRRDSAAQDDRAGGAVPRSR